MIYGSTTVNITQFASTEAQLYAISNVHTIQLRAVQLSHEVSHTSVSSVTVREMVENSK